ncbi:MAG: hypothetical protein ACO3MW_09995 [Rhodospirillales bacterium]
MTGLSGITELLSVTGFLLAIAGVLIAGEAYRRVTPKSGDGLSEFDQQSAEVLQKRIEILEKTIAEMENREHLSGYRLNTDLTDSERFAPSHHVLKCHYLA